MYPLIEIQTVPIEIEVKVTKAKLEHSEYTRGTADLEISRSQDGGVNIRSRAIRVNLDSFQSRNSAPPPPTITGTQSQSRSVPQPAYEAASFSQQGGNVFLNARIDPASIPMAFAAGGGNSGAETISASMTGWDPSEMNIRYEMDKLNFDWRLNQSEMVFTPGDIEISVTQQPDVIIKYVGGPLYVPPSSDPNYEPLDVKA